MWQVIPSIISPLYQFYINDIQFSFCNISGLLIMKTDMEFQAILKTTNNILGKRNIHRKTTSMKYESISYLNSYIYYVLN